MDDIDTVYEKLEGIISREEFEAKVEEKIEEMHNLCDVQTAALLVAHNLGATDVGVETIKIADINEASSNVNFTGKAISVFEPKEFSRDDGTTGRVGNIIVADETGSIRVTLWDDLADLLKTGDISTGKSYNISGYAKEGYSGIEVNIGRGGGISESEENVKANINLSGISEIKDGDSDVNVVGMVLDVSDVRTFQKRDGSEGRVRNITIGDETGKIRITLWDGRTELADKLETGDSVEIINGYARLNNYSQEVEIQVGNHSSLRKTDREVEFKEDYTPIADIIPGQPYSIKGAVSGMGDLKEFTRSNGSEGKVSNIYVSDETGRIRIALWDEKAELVDKVDIDTPIKIIDAFAKSGFNEEVELNAGGRSKVIVD